MFEKLCQSYLIAIDSSQCPCFVLNLLHRSLRQIRLTQLDLSIVSVFLRSLYRRHSIDHEFPSFVPSPASIAPSPPPSISRSFSSRSSKSEFLSAFHITSVVAPSSFISPIAVFQTIASTPVPTPSHNYSIRLTVHQRQDQAHRYNRTKINFSSLLSSYL